MSEIIEYLSIYSEYSDFLRNIRHFTECSSKKKEYSYYSECVQIFQHLFRPNIRPNYSDEY